MNSGRKIRRFLGLKSKNCLILPVSGRPWVSAIWGMGQLGFSLHQHLAKHIPALSLPTAFQNNCCRSPQMRTININTAALGDFFGPFVSPIQHRSAIASFARADLHAHVQLLRSSVPAKPPMFGRRVNRTNDAHSFFMTDCCRGQTRSSCLVSRIFHTLTNNARAYPDSAYCCIFCTSHFTTRWQRYISCIHNQ